MEAGNKEGGTKGPGNAPPASMKRGIVFTLLTQAPTLLLYFVSSLLMTRMLGDVGRGEYALLNNFSALLSMLVSLNLGYGVTYFISRSGGDPRHGVGAATSLILINVPVVLLILWGVSRSAPMSDVLMPTSRLELSYWAFVYIMVVLGLVNSSISAVLLAYKKFKALNVMSVYTAASSAVGFALLYLFSGDAGDEGSLGAVLITTVVVSLSQTLLWCVFYGLLVRIRPKPLLKWSLLRPIFVFSLVGHLSNLINLINYRFDVWVVDQYHGAANLGLYAVAVGMAQLLFYIPDPFARVVQPFLFGQMRDELLSRFKAVVRLSFSAVLALAVVMAALAPWVMPVLFGEVFGASVTALWLLLPGILFSGSTKILSQLVVQGGYQHFNLVATSVGAVCTVVLDLMLIPSLGIAGAAIASSLAYFVVLLIVVFTIRYRMGIPVHDLFIVQASDIRQVRMLRPW